jgi:hyperosmotically inducible protein
MPVETHPWHAGCIYLPERAFAGLSFRLKRNGKEQTMKFNRANSRNAAIALAVSACFGTACAMAADKPQEPNPKFEQFDRNHDGFLTRDEVRSIRDFGKAFDQADENRDGKLDQAEFAKADAIHDRIVAGKYVDDSMITAKVKAALLKEPDLKSLDVSVETMRGEVLLSGFVKNDGQRRRALKAAVAVAGVASVKDAMVVR